MSIKITPLRGIRYPDLTETVRLGDVRRMVEDLDTAATKTASVLSAAVRRARAKIHRNTGTLSLPKNVFTTVSGFDTKIYDNTGMANLGVNNDRLTVQVAGLYMFVGRGAFALGSAGVDEKLALFVNGAALGTAGTVQRSAADSSILGGNGLLSVWGAFLMAAGDRVQMSAWWNGVPAGPATLATYALTGWMISPLS